MKYQYPTPADVGIHVPSRLRADRFNAGFLHALKGLHLNKREHLRLSFREGYRAAKLYLNYLRKQQGILPFPMKGKMKFKTAA